MIRSGYGYLAAADPTAMTRDEARRDYSDRAIDRADWLDIRQRTEDDISAARREYDRLTGSATVMSDIPHPNGSATRGNHGTPTTGARHPALSCTASIIKPLPPGANANVADNSKNTTLAVNGKWLSCRSASNSTGAFSRSPLKDSLAYH